MAFRSDGSGEILFHHQRTDGHSECGTESGVLHVDAYRDLRVIVRSKPDECRVVFAVGILRGTCFARHFYVAQIGKSLEGNIPEKLLPFVSDYKINVFEISHLSPEQVGMFKSDFRIVADYFVQTAQNKKYVPSADEIRHVEELFKLLSALTGNHRFEDVYNEEHYQKGEPVTMYDVFTEYENRGRAKGLEAGRAEGRAEGTLLTLCHLVKQGFLTAAIAAKEAGMNEQDFLAKMEQAYPG